MGWKKSSESSGGEVLPTDWEVSKTLQQSFSLLIFLLFDGFKLLMRTS